MQDTKPWYTSRLIWLSLALVAVPFLTDVQVVLSDNEVSGFIVTGLGVLIAVLRALTSTGITVAGVAPAEKI